MCLRGGEYLRTLGGVRSGPVNEIRECGRMRKHADVRVLKHGKAKALAWLVTKSPFSHIRRVAKTSLTFSAPVRN